MHVVVCVCALQMETLYQYLVVVFTGNLSGGSLHPVYARCA